MAKRISLELPIQVVGLDAPPGLLQMHTSWHAGLFSHQASSKGRCRPINHSGNLQRRTYL
ncbi:hypothetical protein Pyn_40795 [Prunus yedoensis var. nudiflora]|uniref:Uncharacterized protein n=1 Tax=Prunus yedoensis var. nudiflora TaxID=2094558 RepID=A0A314Z4R4_PRUYE|nr:hypothetical protein Pyn_40795 [Prunus yedoensis var. nudiflora]